MAEDQTQTPAPADKPPQAAPAAKPDPAAPSADNPSSGGASPPPERKADPHFILDQLVKESSGQNAGQPQVQDLGEEKEPQAVPVETGPEAAPPVPPADGSEPEPPAESAPQLNPESVAPPDSQSVTSESGPEASADELITDAMKKLDEVIRKLKESRKAQEP